MIPPQRREAADCAEVSVDTERETDGGWFFDVTLTRGASRSCHEVRLSWVDYEFWSHGAAAPERVVKALVETTIDLAPERVLPAKFDASTARRWAAGFDERLRAGLGGGVG